MTIGVVGSRNSKGLTIDHLQQYIPLNCTKIVSGGAKGVDSLARDYARQYNIPLMELLPDYKLFGRQAPIIRNTQIVTASDKVLAFWDGKSRGTAHTIKECIRLQIPFEIIQL